MKKKLSRSNSGANYSNTSCSCGRHFGIGTWTGEHRAAVYAWYRDYYTIGYTKERQAYLTSWEASHGHQEPNMHCTIKGEEDGYFHQAMQRKDQNSV